MTGKTTWKIDLIQIKFPRDHCCCCCCCFLDDFFFLVRNLACVSPFPFLYFLVSIAVTVAVSVTDPIDVFYSVLFLIVL